MGSGCTCETASHQNCPQGFSSTAFQLIVSSLSNRERIGRRAVLAGKTLRGGTQESTVGSPALSCRERIGSWSRCTPAVSRTADENVGKLGISMGNLSNH